MIDLVPLTTTAGLVLVRVSAMVLVMPVIGGQQIPARARMVFAVALTMVLAPLVRAEAPALDPVHIATSALAEGLAGAALGLTVRVGLAAADVAAGIVGPALGMDLASVLDPRIGESTTGVARLFHMVAVCVLLVVGGHRLVLAALAESIITLPPGTWARPDALARALVSAAGDGWTLGLRIAAPVAGATLVAQLGLAFVARAAPAFNLFAVGAAAATAVGVAAMLVAFPEIVSMLGAAGPGDRLDRVLDAMRPP